MSEPKISTIAADRYVYLNAIVALLSGLGATITHASNEERLSIILFAILAASLSLFLLQIYISIIISKEDVKKLLQDNSVIPPKNFLKILSEFQALLKKDISKLLVICYGTSGYQKLIDRILDGEYKGVNVDVLICSPDSPHIADDDKKILLSRIERAKSFGNVKMHLALKELPPPSIRACAVYNKKGIPIWCCTQIYTYTHSDPDPNQRVKYDKFHAIVGRKEDGSSLAVEMESFIKEEFKRLAGMSVMDDSEFNEKTFSSAPQGVITKDMKSKQKERKRSRERESAG